MANTELIPDKKRVEDALRHFLVSWEKRQARPGVDVVAAKAGVSNNSVLDLTKTARQAALLVKLSQSRSRERWARLAMQIALALDGQPREWVPPDLWLLDPAAYEAIEMEAKIKVAKIQRKSTSLLQAGTIMLAVFPLTPLGATSSAPLNELRVADVANSFLGALARLAIRSVRPSVKVEFSILSDLPNADAAGEGERSREIRVGIFGTVARGGGEHLHVPAPGLRCRLSCIAPDTERARELRDDRAAFGPVAERVDYCCVPGLSPHSYLRAMHSELPSVELDVRGNRYDPVEVAAAYRLQVARAADVAHRPREPLRLPALVTDEAMAGRVVQELLRSPPAKQPFDAFVDLLDHVPEPPTFPIAFQLSDEDDDLAALLRQATLDQGRLGELFELGALATSRLYARSLVWMAAGPRTRWSRGDARTTSALDELQAVLTRLSTHDTAKVSAVRLPSYGRLWPFADRTPRAFLSLLLDELLCRVTPSEFYSEHRREAKALRRHAEVVSRTFLPPSWASKAVEAWGEARADAGHPLPSYTSDYLVGPVAVDRDREATRGG